jgi:hypothetical protein
VKLSECCGYEIILSDLCSYCKEHCGVDEGNNDNRE